VVYKCLIHDSHLACVLGNGPHWWSILWQALIRHAQQANLADNFLCEFSPKGFKKGGGEAMNCESDLSLATRRGWN